MIRPNLPEEVLNWLYFSDEDSLSSNIMMREKIYNKVCFLSQQTIEKCLKAYLLNRGKEIKRTHKIVDIISECSAIDKGFSQFEDDAVEIDRYYIPTRYPDAVVGSLPEGLPRETDAKSAKEIADRIQEYVKKKLGI